VLASVVPTPNNRHTGSSGGVPGRRLSPPPPRASSGKGWGKRCEHRAPSFATCPVREPEALQTLQPGDRRLVGRARMFAAWARHPGV
jgi:hypothetical protein